MLLTMNWSGGVVLIRDVMSRNIVSTEPNDVVTNAAKKMRDNKVGSSLVIRKNKLVGMVTDRKITTGVVAAGHDPSKIQISKIMTKNPTSVRPDQLECDASKIMAEKKYRRLPVVDTSGKVEGVVSITDLAEHAQTCTNCAFNIFKELSH